MACWGYSYFRDTKGAAFGVILRSKDSTALTVTLSELVLRSELEEYDSSELVSDRAVYLQLGTGCGLLETNDDVDGMTEHIKQKSTKQTKKYN